MIHCHDGIIWEDMDPVLATIEAVHNRANIVDAIDADLLEMTMGKL